VLKIYIVNGGGERDMDKNPDRFADVITGFIMKKIKAFEMEGTSTGSPSVNFNFFSR